MFPPPGRNYGRMRPVLKRLYLLALNTDSEARFRPAEGWQTRCLHCRSRLLVRADGEPISAGSLEHVVPQAWFGKRAAQALCTRVGDDPNDARNLAIVCLTCNHAKGRGPDQRGPGDPEARAIVSHLLDARLLRYRVPESLAGLSA